MTQDLLIAGTYIHMYTRMYMYIRSKTIHAMLHVRTCTYVIG